MLALALMHVCRKKRNSANNWRTKKRKDEREMVLTRLTLAKECQRIVVSLAWCLYGGSWDGRAKAKSRPGL